MVLLDGFLGPPPRKAEKRLPLAVVHHAQARRIAKPSGIEPERAVVVDPHQAAADQIEVVRHRFRARTPVGRQSHQLVLARVDLEAQPVGESRIQQSQRMREVQLAQQPDMAPLTVAERGRGPLPHSVNGQNGRPLER